MKKYIYTAIFSLVLMSCGGSGKDEPIEKPKEENKAPSVPSLNTPANNLLCINNALTFKWAASTDPESQAISYTIEISKDKQFSKKEYTYTGTTISFTATLEKGVGYYWRVKAIDSEKKESAFSETFQFYTEGVGTVNHLPFSPTLVSPVKDASTNAGSVKLEWTATDVDKNDTLTYDVYFGTDANPTTKVSADNTTNNYTVTTTASKTYFWKVNVKDNHDAITKGAVWSFKTN